MRLVRKIKKIRANLIPYNIKHNIIQDQNVKNIGCFGTNLNDKNLHFIHFSETGIKKEEYNKLGEKIIKAFDYNYNIIQEQFFSTTNILKYLNNSYEENQDLIPFKEEVVKLLEDFD